MADCAAHLPPPSYDEAVHEVEAASRPPVHELVIIIISLKEELCFYFSLFVSLSVFRLSVGQITQKVIYEL